MHVILVAITLFCKEGKTMSTLYHPRTEDEQSCPKSSALATCHCIMPAGDSYSSRSRNSRKTNLTQKLCFWPSKLVQANIKIYTYSTQCFVQCIMKELCGTLCLPVYGYQFSQTSNHFFIIQSQFIFRKQKIISPSQILCKYKVITQT